MYGGSYVVNSLNLLKHAMMRLQFVHVHSFDCRGRLRNCGSLLCNNNTAINQTFTSSYDSRRFFASDHAGLPP